MKIEALKSMASNFLKEKARAQLMFLKMCSKIRYREVRI